MSDTDILKSIEEFAELQFSPDEIAVILDSADLESLIRKKGSKEQWAYDRGTLKASAEVRRAIYQQAKNGSTPAQKEMLSIIQKNARKRG